jgi:hypothetical protein
MLAATRRYKRYCDAAGITGRRAVMQMRRFYGPGREWDQPWDPPPADDRPAAVRPPPPAPREPMVAPQRFGDVMRRAMGQAVAEPRYLANKQPHLLLRGVVYPFGADVPSALVQPNLLQAGYIVPAPPTPLPSEES